jgi:putative Ca2+/H+ antiporter (TMEM165/GDT1 family)
MIPRAGQSNFSSQAFMTFLSAALGMATTVLPRKYTFYASVILFSIFGLKLLKEAWEMKSDHAAVRRHRQILEMQSEARRERERARAMER